MIITACEAYPYDLPLLIPFNFDGQILTSRRGFIIHLSDSHNHFGYGEVSPFLGLHKENIDLALAQFNELRPKLIGKELCDHLAALDGGFEDWLGRYGLCPALRYGIEMAVLNLLACEKFCSLARLLASSCPQQLPISGLLITGQGYDLDSQLQRLSALGFNSVKLKVGRRSLREDIDAVRATRKRLGNSVKLRLDANRCWDFATAVRFAHAIADCDIEYIEEPLIDSAVVSDFYSATAIPVALDESLIAQDLSALSIPHGVQAFILKPSVLGGLEKTNAFIACAKQRNIKAVISSVFESGVSLAALANCAASLAGAGAENAAGLDTYRWLADDVLYERFLHTSSINIEQAHDQAQRLKAGVTKSKLGVKVWGGSSE